MRVNRHPELDIELIPESRDVSLTHREADLAIRLARPTAGGRQVKTRKIGQLSYSVYVSGEVTSKEARKLPWISYDDQLAHIPPAQWMRKVSAQRTEVLSPLKVYDVETARLQSPGLVKHFYQTLWRIRTNDYAARLQVNCQPYLVAIFGY